MDPSNAVTDEAKARKERENFIVDFLDVDNRSNRIIVGNENCDHFRDKKERCFYSRIASMIFSPNFLRSISCWRLPGPIGHPAHDERRSTLQRSKRHTHRLWKIQFWARGFSTCNYSSLYDVNFEKSYRSVRLKSKSFCGKNPMDFLFIVRKCPRLNYLTLHHSCFDDRSWMLFHLHQVVPYQF